jgi:hypothetical protein
MILRCFRDFLIRQIEGCRFSGIDSSKNWKDNNYLGNDRASIKVKYQPVDLDAYAKLVAAISSLPPEQR